MGARSGLHGEERKSVIHQSEAERAALPVSLKRSDGRDQFYNSGVSNESTTS